MTLEYGDPTFSEVVSELKDLADFFIGRGYPTAHAFDLANEGVKHKFNEDCLGAFSMTGLTIGSAPRAPKMLQSHAPQIGEADKNIIDVPSRTNQSTKPKKGRRDTLAEKEARLAEGLFMPTEIGKRFNMSATKLNRVLVAMGLQTKNKGTGYTLTDKGIQAGGMVRHYPGTSAASKRIVWRESIFNLIEAELEKIKQT
jgi:hypothetical protein